MQTITMGSRDIYKDTITISETKPAELNVIIDITEAYYLPSFIDVYLTDIIAETISSYMNGSDIYEMSLSAVSNFFESCGFKSSEDHNDYVLVNRLIGVDSLFCMVEDIFQLVIDKINTFCGDVKNFCLVEWVNNNNNYLEGLYWIDKDPYSTNNTDFMFNNDRIS